MCGHRRPIPDVDRAHLGERGIAAPRDERHCARQIVIAEDAYAGDVGQNGLTDGPTVGGRKGAQFHAPPIGRRALISDPGNVQQGALLQAPVHLGELDVAFGLYLQADLRPLQQVDHLHRRPQCQG